MAVLPPEAKQVDIHSAEFQQLPESQKADLRLADDERERKAEAAKTSTPPPVSPTTKPPVTTIEASVPGIETARPDQVGGQVATIEGQQFYIPGSTMYSLGYRTPDEFFEAQKAGVTYGPHPGSEVPKDSVIVEVRGALTKKPIPIRVSPIDTAETGDAGPAIITKINKGKFRVPVIATSEKGETTQLLLTPAKAKKVTRLKGEEQFIELQKLGVYPTTWTYSATKAADKEVTIDTVKPATKRKITTGKQALRALIDDGTVPPNAVLLSYNKATGVVRYKIATNPVLRKYIDSKGKLSVDDAVAAGITDIDSYIGWGVTQSDIDRIKERERAKATLKEFEYLPGLKTTKGKYNVVDALLSDNPEVIEATRTLFKPEDIAKAETWIDKNFGPQGRYLFGKYVPGSKKVSKFWRDITPWKEGKGETFTESIKKVPLPAPLAGITPALGAVAVAEPTPIGEITLGLLLGGAAAYTILTGKQKPKTAADKAFVSQFSTKVSPYDITLVNPTTGEVANVAEIVATSKLSPELKEKLGVPPLEAPLKTPVKESLEAQLKKGVQEEVIPLPSRPSGMIVTKSLTPDEAAEFSGTFVNWQEPVVFIGPGGQFPIPQRIIEDAGKSIEQKTGMIIAADLAAKSLPRVVVQESPISRAEYDALGTAIESVNQSRIDKAFKVLNEGMERAKVQNRVTADVALAYARAYNAYLAQRAALTAQQAAREAARAKYIKDINESLTPAFGKSNQEITEAVANATLAKTLGLTSPKVGVSFSEHTSTLIGKAVGTTLKTATQAATQTMTEALAQGQTLTQAQTKAATAAETAINNATQAMTDTAVQTAVQSATQALTNTAVNTATQTATQSATMAQTATQAATTTTTGRPIPLPRGGTDKEKRKAIKDAGGGIAWRQGELGGKDVWHCIKYPYASESDYLTVLGRKPSNTTIVKGPGSAFQTVKLRYGKPPAKSLTGDIGFMDFRIDPRGGRNISISFKADPKGETTGDITIGRKMPAITERMPRLTKRGSMRITPRTPRLR